ncbi:MAG: hypothetical protein K6T17_06035, partial [Fimbriimonadales bacterium]|nr:hypothetical protein [Fimbriimonadales bacterium]
MNDVMFLVSLVALLAPATLEVAFGVVDITPPEPLPLGGYTERGDRTMEGVKDPLTARALFLRQGGREVVLISAELLTIPGSLSREVEKRLFPEGEGDVFLAATHTHCAPDSQMFNDRMTFKIRGIASYQSRWLEWYADRIAGLAKARGPYQEVEEIRILQTKALLNHPRGVSPQVDSRLTRIRFVLKKGGFIDLLHYPAHPTVYGPTMMKTSGDFPGEWLNRGGYRMFFNGAMGDALPAPPGGLTGEAGVQAMAQALEDALREAENHNPSPEVRCFSLFLTFRRLSLSLPAPIPHPEFAERFGAPPVLARQLVRAFAPPEASLLWVQVGSVAFLGVPGEPTAEVGQELETAPQWAL